jgi:hypothetical protein
MSPRTLAVTSAVRIPGLLRDDRAILYLLDEAGDGAHSTACSAPRPARPARYPEVRWRPIFGPRRAPIVRGGAARPTPGVRINLSRARSRSPRRRSAGSRHCSGMRRPRPARRHTRSDQPGNFICLTSTENLGSARRLAQRGSSGNQTSQWERSAKALSSQWNAASFSLSPE